MKKVYFFIGVVFLITTLLILVLLPVEVKGYKTEAKKFLSAVFELNKKLKDDSNIVDYTIQYKLPNILEIKIISKKAFFAIYNTSENKYTLISSKGEILGTKADTNLPYIIQETNNINLFCLNLIRMLNSTYNISHGELKNDTMLVDMPSGVRVIFPIKGDYKVIFSGMELIYKKITDDYYGKFKEIDMRFDSPVLR